MKTTCQYFIRFVKITLKVVLFFILFILIYLLFAFLLPYVKVNNAEKAQHSDVEIFVLSNGVHTDIVLPVKTTFIDWQQLLPYNDFEMVDSTFHYIALGWGDKGFYLETPTWADLKASTALKAALGLSTTAMHVTYRKTAPKVGELCKRLIISVEQYKLLYTQILNSFIIKKGKPLKINHPGYNNYDCFYEADGCYSMFKTCNVWTGSVLKSAKIKVGIWTPFHKGVLESIE